MKRNTNQKKAQNKQTASNCRHLVAFPVQPTVRSNVEADRMINYFAADPERLPASIQHTAPPGKQWAIETTRSGHYRFYLRDI